MSAGKTAFFAAIALAATLVAQPALGSTGNGSLGPTMPEAAEQAACSYGFTELVGGTANITVSNPPAGQTVVAASASNLSDPKGYILFANSQSYAVWWTQSVGAQSYSFKSGGGVAGYLSCSLGLSLYLVKYAHDQTEYLLPTQNYQEFLVIVLCYTQGCGEAYAAGQPLIRVEHTAFGHTLTFFYGIVGFNGTYIAVNVSSTPSSVFLIGVSHELYGWVKGTVSPKSALVLVNGTPYPTPGGIINWTLPFGIYNVTFLAKGYANMSVVVAVAAGRVTPLYVSLANPTLLYEKTLLRFLGYYLLGLLGFLAALAGFLATKRGMSSLTTKRWETSVVEVACRRPLTPCITVWLNAHSTRPSNRPSSATPNRNFGRGHLNVKPLKVGVYTVTSKRATG